MAWKSDPSNFKYTIVDGFDKVFDEKGNNSLRLRQIQWGERDKVYLDMRKWISKDDGSEEIGKGVSFLTDNGPGELINTLIDSGYGNTQEIVKHLSYRDDFIPSISDALGETITPEQLERFKNNVIKYNAEDMSDVYDPRDMDLGDE